MDADKVIRIGDAEREQAVSAIGEHFAAGRLERHELDERIDAAWRARTRADLAVLFTDLPGASPVAAPPAAMARWPRQPVTAGPRGYSRYPSSSRLSRLPAGLFVVLAIILLIKAPFLTLLLIPVFWLLVIRFVFVRVVRRRIHRTAFRA